MVTPVFSVLTCEIEDVLKSKTQQNQNVVLVRKKKKADYRTVHIKHLHSSLRLSV